MKTRNNITIIAALCIAFFCLGACGGVNESDNQGVIRINFDKTSGRYVVSNDDIAKMAYTVTLSRASSNKAAIVKKTETSAESISISVPEGIWDIDVKAEGKGMRTGKGAGKKTNVTVAAGELAPVNIVMNVTGTRVSSWSELKEDFDELNKANGKLKNLEEIEIIAAGLEASETKMENAPTLKIEKIITLWSEVNVSIRRTDITSIIDATVFTVEKGTLILDGVKGGTITIEGNGHNNTKCQRALINVLENGTLIMRDGVTLTNNHTTNFGGGVYINDGRFYMEGGTISGNTADESGGGVYVDGRSSSKKTGVFKKTGGIIYGSNADDTKKNKSNRNNNGDGDAVYDRVTPYNETLGLKDNWPR